MIPSEIVSRFECVVFHMTDLPYGRGGSPLQNLIKRGHKQTKLSALRCVRGVDEGPIYLKESLSLEGAAEEILQRASYQIEKMIIQIVTQRLTPNPQRGEVVQFRRRGADESDISQVEDLDGLYDHIRMLDADGYPPAFLQSPQFRFEFKSAKRMDSFVEAVVRVRVADHE